MVQQIKQYGFREYVILQDFVRHRNQSINPNAVADANAPAVVVQFIKMCEEEEK